MKNHREFFQYVIPSMLAFALSGIYSIADGFFVGNAMGDSALAAINVAYPLTAFLQATGTGIGMGGAVEYSIAMGSQKPRRSRELWASAFLYIKTAAAPMAVKSHVTVVAARAYRILLK